MLRKFIKLFKTLFKSNTPKNKPRNNDSETTNCSAAITIINSNCPPNHDNNLDPNDIVDNINTNSNFSLKNDPTVIAWREYYKTHDPSSIQNSEKEISIQKTQHKPTVPLTSIKENEITITIRKCLCWLYSIEILVKNGPETDTKINQNVFVFKGKVFIFKNHYEFDIKEIDLGEEFYKGLDKFKESFDNPQNKLLISDYTNLKIISQENLNDCTEFTEDEKQTLKTFLSKNPYEKDRLVNPIYAIRVANLDEKQPSKQPTGPRVLFETEATTTISGAFWRNAPKRTNIELC